MPLSQQQIENVQIDYGIIYTNYGLPNAKILGPCRGGGEFKATAKIRDITFDGSIGKTKGTQVIDEITAALSVTILDTSMESLALSMPYATFDGTKITCGRSSIGVIQDSSYIENITMFAKTIGGLYKKISLLNAMAENDFALAAKPKGEGEIKLDVSAHWDATDDAADLFTVEDVANITGDVTKPTIVTIPADAAAAIVISSNLTAVFSKDIKQSDITASDATHSGNFTLIKASDGTIIPGALTYTKATKTALFDPTANLTAATAYIWTISGVKDLAGNIMDPVVVNFTTA